MKGYESTYWLTFNQAKKKGAQVRKGEKSTLVVFWKQYAFQDKESGEEQTVPVIRHYNLFNADQCQGIEAPDQLPPEEDGPPFEPLEAAEQIVRNYPNPPTIEHRGSQACYRPGADLVLIADPKRFVSRESYYVTHFPRTWRIAVALKNDSTETSAPSSAPSVPPTTQKKNWSPKSEPRS